MWWIASALAAPLQFEIKLDVDLDARDPAEDRSAQWEAIVEYDPDVSPVEARPIGIARLVSSKNGVVQQVEPQTVYAADLRDVPATDPRRVLNRMLPPLSRAALGVLARPSSTISFEEALGWAGSNPSPFDLVFKVKEVKSEISGLRSFVATAKSRNGGPGFRETLSSQLSWDVDTSVGVVQNLTSSTTVKTRGERNEVVTANIGFRARPVGP